MAEKKYSSTWFTEMGNNRPIGIVIVWNINNGNVNEAFIGIGIGKNQREDEIMISERGAKFPLSEALRLIK